MLHPMKKREGIKKVISWSNEIIHQTKHKAMTLSEPLVLRDQVCQNHRSNDLHDCEPQIYVIFWLLFHEKSFKKWYCLSRRGFHTDCDLILQHKGKIMVGMGFIKLKPDVQLAKIVVAVSFRTQQDSKWALSQACGSLYSTENGLFP